MTRRKVWFHFGTSASINSQGRLMKKLSMIAMAMLIVACTSHEVRCDGGLQPINTPTASRTAPQKSVAGASERRP